MCAAGSSVCMAASSRPAVETQPPARDANLAIGHRRKVPALRQAAQFRHPKNALHAGGGSQSERSLGRDGAPLRERSSQIARQDLIATPAPTARQPASANAASGIIA